MKKRKAMKKMIAMGLGISMAWSSMVYAAGSDEVPVISFYPSSADAGSGVVGGNKGEVFAQYGFGVEIWAYSEEKTNAILASADLPDVMMVRSDQLEVLIENEMILNLEDYLDQLPNIAEKDYMQPALNYMREYNSNGTGGLWALPCQVSAGKSLEYDITKNMLTVNWDCFESIGCPEITDQWQLIDVMEEMLEANPLGEDGTTNYGICLNAGSDGTYWGNINLYLKWFGYEPTELPYLLETDMINAEYSSILSEDSKYYEGLKWYNTVYRRNLMDPDSINIDRATQSTKINAGHAMVSAGTVQGYAKFQPVYMENQQIYQESWSSPYGGSNYFVVNAKSENIDAVMKFLNMLADPDAYLYTWIGLEGDLWTAEGDVLTLKEGLAEAYANTGEVTFETGEKVDYWRSWIIDDSSIYTSYKDADGESRLPSLAKFSEVREVKFNNDKQNAWREWSGYDFYVDQVMAADAYYLTSELDNVSNFAPVADDTLQLTLDAIKDVVVNASWQMVYAESEEEFDAIWNDMVDDCNELGAEQVIADRIEALEEAKVVRDSLEN